MDAIVNFMANDLPNILTAALAAIGGLKLLARYTPWEWDDKILDVIEKPLRFAFDKLKKK